MQSSRGFTLIELMITVAVLAVLLGIAVPSFKIVIENNRVSTQTNEFLAALQVARSAADAGLATNSFISVTAKSGSFQNGWCIYKGRDQNCDAVTPIVAHESIDIKSIVVTAVEDVSGLDATQFVFERKGGTTQMISPSATLTLRPPSCEAGESRMRVISVKAAGAVPDRTPARTRCP